MIPDFDALHLQWHSETVALSRAVGAGFPPITDTALPSIRERGAVIAMRYPVIAAARDVLPAVEQDGFDIAIGLLFSPELSIETYWSTYERLGSANRVGFDMATAVVRGFLRSVKGESKFGFKMSFDVLGGAPRPAPPSPPATPTVPIPMGPNLPAKPAPNPPSTAIPVPPPVAAVVSNVLKTAATAVGTAVPPPAPEPPRALDSATKALAVKGIDPNFPDGSRPAYADPNYTTNRKAPSKEGMFAHWIAEMRESVAPELMAQLDKEREQKSNKQEIDKTIAGYMAFEGLKGAPDTTKKVLAGELAADGSARKGAIAAIKTEAGRRSWWTRLLEWLGLRSPSPSGAVAT